RMTARRDERASAALGNYEEDRLHGPMLGHRPPDPRGVRIARPGGTAARSVQRPTGGAVGRRAHQVRVDLQGLGDLALAVFGGPVCSRRRAISSSGTSSSSRRLSTSMMMRSPSSMRPMSPPSAASGEMWPSDTPLVPPEKRPSVISAQVFPSPRPLRKEVG